MGQVFARLCIYNMHIQYVERHGEKNKRVLSQDF